MISSSVRMRVVVHERVKCQIRLEKQAAARLLSTFTMSVECAWATDVGSEKLMSRL